MFRIIEHNMIVLAPDMSHGFFIVMCAYECGFVRCGFLKSRVSDVKGHFPFLKLRGKL